MIVAAIENSSYTNDSSLNNYRSNVFRVLSSLQGPIRVILWNDTVQSDTTHTQILDQRQIFGNHVPFEGFHPDEFLKALPDETPLDLYVFTVGPITRYHVVDCRFVLNYLKRKVQISHVYLYYMIIRNEIKTHFMLVFRGIPQDIYMQSRLIAKIPAVQNDFSMVDYDYIMKDDSFKATVLSLLSTEGVEKTDLKAQVEFVLNDILERRFDDKLYIRNFYETRDVPGCCAYIEEKHAYQKEKSVFQKKMSSILGLFEKGINIYSLRVHRDKPDTEKDIKPEALEDFQPEGSDFVFDKRDVRYIIVKSGGGRLWPDKIQNPFQLLDSEEKIERILLQVEPFILYCNKTHRDVLRNRLKNDYVLHQPQMDAQAVMRHNNYVLSTFFRNKLHGNPVLWHVVFLYLLGTRKFPDRQEIFFREIRRLCESESYFVPPIVETLDVCFWYVACVCPVLWPTDAQNLLRREGFVSDSFLDLYRDVYDPEYRPPELWKLWHELHGHPQSIFAVLSRYFRHEKVGPGDFGTILYRERIEPAPALDLQTVLNVYDKFIRYDGPPSYEKLIEPADVRLFDEGAEEKDQLQHVRINLETCHPYVTCSSSGKHWRECIGEYDQMKQSYLRLFRRYCDKYRKYPKSSQDLMVFLNQFVFEHKKKIPELFESALPRQMAQVMQIFREVMEKYTCEQYLRICKRYYPEKLRLMHE